jgi:hypothetical protein
MKTAVEARDKLLEIGQQLTAYDFGNLAVSATSRSADGAMFFWPDAFALEWHGWVFVFTEHYGYHQFHDDEMFVRIYGGNQFPVELPSADLWTANPASRAYLKGRDSGAEARLVTRSRHLRK